jgi:hypothetical protein
MRESREETDERTKLDDEDAEEEEEIMWSPRVHYERASWDRDRDRDRDIGIRINSGEYRHGETDLGDSLGYESTCTTARK